MCKANLFALMQYCLPKRLLSRLAGAFAESTHPKLKSFLIQQFMKYYPVDLEESEFTRPEDYASFSQFFTRALKTDARPIPQEPHVLVSPADGKISQFGKVSSKGRILQAKGHDYSLFELLGGEFKDIASFQEGFFSTVYLAPHNYHRVHLPMDAELLALTYCPGDLFSVNQSTAENVPNLFARNERAVLFFQTEHGKMALVLVGAMIVCGIETVITGPICHSSRREILHIDYTRNAKMKRHFKRGEEIGRFQFGSTVIVLHESRNLTMTFDANLPLEMGQILAKFQDLS